ncbi:hypothetical protein [Massilia sp. PAMC28688]|uniref:hypothetical protein n=1 Tax=Massilia sp. PAMC28688 TaxID=2861283 RepID=UPI001E5D6ABD|nr:hypothetical protein [Massilia sp. PAMC28688]
MDSVIKENVLAVTRCGRGTVEATAWFRTALGLYYLSGLMTPDELDFKKVDRDFNRFIYQSIGKGHSITSVLQFMSGDKVVAVVESPRFIAAMKAHCPQVPVNTIPFLLSLNLGVAKNISKVDIGGALLDWIERQPTPVPSEPAAVTDAASDGATEAADGSAGPGGL